MKKKFTLSATARQDVGKGASRRLRLQDRVPGIVYGADKEPTTISLDHKAVLRALENESIYSSILTLNLDGNDEQVVLRDLQRHPFKPRVTHMDLQRISAKEKITMRVPLHFTGEDLAPGVKLAGGLISHLMAEVEVRCLPADLPEFIDIDLSHLEINQAVHLSELKLPAGVEIIDLIHGEDKPIATAYIPRAVEEEVAAPSAAEVPVVGEEAAPAEGEAAAGEGEAKGKEKAPAEKEKKGKKE